MSLYSAKRNKRGPKVVPGQNVIDSLPTNKTFKNLNGDASNVLKLNLNLSESESEVEDGESSNDSTDESI